MTVAVQRQKIQQLGFWDPEVAKPLHDDITKWAYVRAEALARAYVAYRAKWFEEKFDSDVDPDWPVARVADARAKYPVLGEPPIKYAVRIRGREWEAVLRERDPEYHPRQLPRNQRLLGYADLLVHFSLQQLGVAERQGGPSGRDHAEWYVREREFRLIVEVKTILPTIGELMRQINLYREAYSHVVLVAPDDGYAELLGEQGVLFVRYDPGAPTTALVV